MKKISFEEFKEEGEKFQGKDIVVKISKVIELSMEITNAQFDINLDYILISNKNDNFKIDTNYISNFYEDENLLKCEINQMMEILILHKFIS